MVRKWEELHELVKKRYLSGSGTCKRHTVRRKKKKMTKIERLVTEGNEKADELARAEAMLDEGLKAEARAVAM